jgi:membrane carboxypeptidase/penicillin-binding protein PbpC
MEMSKNVEGGEAGLAEVYQVGNAGVESHAASVIVGWSGRRNAKPRLSNLGARQAVPLQLNTKVRVYTPESQSKTTQASETSIPVEKIGKSSKGQCRSPPASYIQAYVYLTFINSSLQPSEYR